MESDKETSSSKLNKIVEKLSFVPCRLGFHDYKLTAQGILYSSYQCTKCGKEDIDN